MAKKKTKKTSQLNASLSVVALGVIMLAVAVVILLTQGNKNTTVVQVTRTSVPAQAADIPYPEIPRVSLADAKAAYDQGTAVFVDVRSQGEYETEHISGALSIPEVEMVNRLSELSPQDWIITYCTWPAEQTSARVAQFLIERGFSNVTPVLGSFQAWQSAGYPVESGK